MELLGDKMNEEFSFLIYLLCNTFNLILGEEKSLAYTKIISSFE